VPLRVDSGAHGGVEEDRASILIVDDLDEKLLVFETVLEHPSYDLVCARSGAQALKHVLKTEFAAILLDVNMPDIDGFETAALIRQYKRSAHTPVIFVTAYADEMQTIRGYSLGAVDYILSPIVPEALRSNVRVSVHLHLTQRRPRRPAEERHANAGAQPRRSPRRTRNAPTSCRRRASAQRIARSRHRRASACSCWCRNAAPARRARSATSRATLRMCSTARPRRAARFVSSIERRPSSGTTRPSRGAGPSPAPSLRPPAHRIRCSCP
jgi:CheY-like chemotaxis protein